MSVEEFDREFDILYNNITSNAAPSIDAYEKSVFLNKAQEDIVVALYNGTFEGNEQMTESLKPLLKSKAIDSKKALSPAWKSELLSHNSKLFELPVDTLFIVYESVLPYKDGEIIENLINPKEVEVTPIKHDQYSRLRYNPFRGPSKRRSLRATSLIKIKDSDTPKEVLEVITSYDLFVYKIRYIRKPKPIILYNEESLTINGQDSKSGCELPEILHRTILEAAVKLAALTYKQ